MPADHAPWARYAAPAAFLLAVTIAVLLVRSALDSGGKGGAPTTRPTVTQRHAPRYYRVKAGDSYGRIASRFGLTVARLERLNPRVQPTALFIGQRIRVG
jgi:LysM repeat protein